MQVLGNRLSFSSLWFGLLFLSISISILFSLSFKLYLPHLVIIHMSLIDISHFKFALASLLLSFLVFTSLTYIYSLAFFFPFIGVPPWCSLSGSCSI